MTRRTIAWGMVVVGWACHTLALVTPAIDCVDVGGGPKSGAWCWFETFTGDWLFAPILPIYALANIVFLASLPTAAGSADSRCIGGSFILFWFLLALAAPWCIPRVTGVYIGCVLWQVSYLLVGVGLIRLADAECDRSSMRPTADRRPAGL
jgi:hypothetical protein